MYATHDLRAGLSGRLNVPDLGGMKDGGIGRILVAALHQGIADLVPSRLEFYENWLTPIGLRDGTIGLAPLAAVLSFLRRENGLYGAVTARAGEYAARWMLQDVRGLRRVALTSMPRIVRVRVALGICRELVRTSYAGSRAIVRVSRDLVNVDVRSSIFCGVREPSASPLCGYYASAFREILRAAGVPAEAAVVECRATAERRCLIRLDLAGRAAEAGLPSEPSESA
jgi:hypothetical protein